MRFKLVLCCLIVAAAVQAEPIENQRSRSIFAYTKSLGLGGQVRCLYDMIVLKDGALLTGDVGTPSLLAQDFGSLDFDKEKVCLISIPSETPEKVHIITSDGNIYVGSVNDESLTFIEYVAVYDTSRHQSRTLNFDEISFVLFKPKQKTFFANTEKQEANLHGDSNQKLRGFSSDSNGGVGLSFTPAVRSEVKKEAIPEASGLEVVVAKTEKPKKEILAIFTAQTEFGIPEGVEFPEELEPVFAVVESDLGKAEQMISDELLVLGEDFDLEEWEPETDQENESELNVSEEVMIISQDNSKKELGVDNVPQASQSDEIAYLDVNEGKDAELEASTQVETNLDEDVRLDKSDTPVEVLGLKGVYAGMAYVAPEKKYPSGFYINVRPVTNREYEKFVQAINYSTPSHWLRGEIPPGFEDRSVVNISYRDAFLFAVWSGKRLPSEEELRRFTQENGAEWDFDNNLREWTSTPSSNVSSKDEEAFNSLQSKPFHPGHLILGPKQEASFVRNEEYNSYTGFRLAGDAQ